MDKPVLDTPKESCAKRPRLGFLGIGWIGRHRMEAIAEAGIAEIVGIADPSAEMLEAAQALATDAVMAADLDSLLDLELDGVVIATPSALHAEQSIAALERGTAVFCQKPLGRTAREVEMVLAAARRADRLLAVDFSYRFTEGMRRVRDLVQSGELGEIYAVELVFHNAYGPDKSWFYDPALSGGGCVMDLGVHLVDLALWTLDFPGVAEVNGHLLAGGKPLPPQPRTVEDYADATLRLETGTVVRLACSWRLQAGMDALISAAFYGTRGGVALRNVNGSFYDFTAERYRGTAREVLTSPPDAWGGRAGVAWVKQLAACRRYDPAAERLLDIARVLDRIYGR
ncbi:Gfo/Idh/MocA family protein [Rhodoligotrophos defluvii]|uniref:Gfo/Idh/MocA family protein n=1 Tax=Rhodoligotrophos defluvii TaxID=2561934 RepID=UPI0010C9A3ED|nr:Gfo/Idh/MocA family oxidoreductase [Rhodoligotrophos defluvii]